MSDSTLQPEDDAWLLEHAEWLRSLCHQLVQGSDAGDLAQDTLLAAIRNPPHERLRLRAWLARVARNEAHGARRRRFRREARERRSARVEALPSTAEVSENLRVQRLVVEAVSALDEPYRSTPVHRYYEGLSCSEIARCQGLPASTIRSRLQRAHALTRASLRLELGDSRWLPALLPLAFRGAPRKAVATSTSHAAIATTAGVLGMKKALTLAAVIATTLAGGWFIIQPLDSSPPDIHAPAVTGPDVAAPTSSMPIVGHVADEVPTRTQADPPAPVERASITNTGSLQVAVQPPDSQGRVILRLSSSDGIFDWCSSSSVEQELSAGKAMFSDLPYDHFALIEVHLDDLTEGLPWTHECGGPTEAEPDVVVAVDLPGALPVVTGRLIDEAGTPQQFATLLSRLTFPRAVALANNAGQADPVACPP